MNPHNVVRVGAHATLACVEAYESTYNSSFFVRKFSNNGSYVPFYYPANKCEELVYFIASPEKISLPVPDRVSVRCGNEI